VFLYKIFFVGLHNLNNQNLDYSMSVLVMSVGEIIRLQKLYIIYFVNRYSYQIINIVINNLKPYKNLVSQINWITLFVCIIWLVHSIVVWALFIYSMTENLHSDWFTMVTIFEYLYTIYTGWI